MRLARPAGRLLMHRAMEHATLELGDGRRIAYHRSHGQGPGVVFLGGFRSDMTGTKARFLEAWAKGVRAGLLRFDYTGHGASSGDAEAGAISDWARDAQDAVVRLTEGPQVLVGSSMGGWIALILAGRIPGRIAGLVGVAAAPDFTEDAMWAGMDAPARAKLLAGGRIELPSEYGDANYAITRRLIEDGRRHLVLRTPLELSTSRCGCCMAPPTGTSTCRWRCVCSPMPPGRTSVSTS